MRYAHGDLTATAWFGLLLKTGTPTTWSGGSKPPRPPRNIVGWLPHLEQNLRQPVRHVDHGVVAARHLVAAPRRVSF
jgi:hypothetical protein